MTRAASVTRRLNIVFASHTYMGGTFVVGSHHLARQFASEGHRVVHLSVPITPAHLIKLWNPDVRRRFANMLQRGMAHNGVHDLVPFAMLPFHLAEKANLSRERNWHGPRHCRQLLQRFGMEQIDLLLIDDPRLIGLPSQLKPTTLVYRATDLYAQMRGPWLLSAERELARTADFCIGTSEPVVTHLKQLRGDDKVSRIENGVAREHFLTPQPETDDLRGIAKPRAVYVGAFDERFDFDTIENLAQRMPQLQIILIGPTDRAARRRLQTHRNIHVLGPRPFTRLPAYLPYCQIALLPMSGHGANSGRSPMKLYEYGTSGLPVVATHSPELARRNHEFVKLARDSESFIAEVDRILKMNDPQPLAELARTESQQYGWEAIARRMLALCVPKS